MNTFLISDSDFDDGFRTTRGVVAIAKWSQNVDLTPGRHFCRGAPKRLFLPPPGLQRTAKKVYLATFQATYKKSKGSWQ